VFKNYLLVSRGKGIVFHQNLVKSNQYFGLFTGKDEIWNRGSKAVTAADMTPKHVKAQYSRERKRTDRELEQGYG
jgi:hypothetical protein